MPIIGANIVYPIPGATYPVTVPPPPPGSAGTFFAASFSVACLGGPQAVTWGFDGPGAPGAVGNAQFYDQITVQFVWNLGQGGYEFWVNAGPCGNDRVPFMIA
jgi:hypothetical protein